jgi:cystathionine beta-synthase
MRVHDSVVELIGDTPLVRLRSVTAGIAADVVAKIEYFNPGGSSKDRIALRMIESAERDGLLRPGGVVVGPTSGNTGVGLALVAQLKGYRCVFTCPDKVSEEKIDLLRAYGAQVVVCPAAVPPQHPDSYRSVSARIAADTPGAVLIDQYHNEHNPASHYHGTGPEIWRQTDGRLTHFVAGVGTGGTICGAGRYLKEVSGGAVRIVGADPDGSVYSGGTGRPYLLEGVGQPSFPGSFDPAVPDEILGISDRDSIAMTRRLACEEGLLTGGSCGMAVVAALRTARRLRSDALVVVLLPDSGRGYLSKIFNDRWLIRMGLHEAAGDAPRVMDVLASRSSAEIPALPCVTPDDTIAVAIKTMAQSSARQLLVSTAAPPRLAEILGTVTESSLADALSADPRALDDPVARHMDPPPPCVGAAEPVTAALAAARTSGAVLVLDGGLPCGLLDAARILNHLSNQTPATTGAELAEPKTDPRSSRE